MIEDFAEALLRFINDRNNLADKVDRLEKEIAQLQAVIQERNEQEFRASDATAKLMLGLIEKIAEGK